MTEDDRRRPKTTAERRGADPAGTGVGAQAIGPVVD
jgi:hypothetical protein